MTKDYCLSPVEAHTLTNDIKEYVDQNCETVVKEGLIVVTASANDEPAGKALNSCRKKVD